MRTLARLLALLAFIFAAPALAASEAQFAQVYTPGVPDQAFVYGLTNQITIAGGGGGSYVARGIHFDWQKSSLFTAGARSCTTTLNPCAPGTAAPLTATYGPVVDGPHLTVSYWIKAVPYLSTTSTQGMSETIGNTDLVSHVEVSQVTESSEGVPGFNTVFDSSSGQTNTLRMNIMSQPSGTGLAAQYACNTSLPALYTPTWTHILYSFDGTVSGTTKAFAAYINGVRQKAGCGPTLSGTFNIGFSNNNGWEIANFDQTNTGKGTFEISDVFVDMRTSVVCTGVNTPATINGIAVDCSAGANTIPPQILAKFRDGSGNPVDLGANCSTPTAQRPELCFSGDSSSFAANKGSVTNTFVGGSTLFDAVTAPGNTPAHRVIPKGLYGDWVTGAADATPLTTSSTGIPIKAGDLIFAFLKVEDTSGLTNHNIQCPTSSAGAFIATSVGNAQGTSANIPINTMICYRIAATDGESDVLTWTWTTNPAKSVEWITGVFGGVNTTTPIQAAAVQTAGPTSNTTTYVAPSVTAGAANQLLLTIFDEWATGPSNFSGPTGYNRLYTGSAGSNTAINYELTAGPGATGTRTATGTNDSGIEWSIILNPN